MSGLTEEEFADRILKTYDGVLHEIDAIKHHFIKTAANFVAAIVKNNDLSPKYLEGDFFIGFLENSVYKFLLLEHTLIERKGGFSPITY